MLNLLLIIAVTLVLVAVAIHAYGSFRWGARTEVLRSALLAGRVPMTAGAVDFAELEGLPAPVQRFFRAVLTEGRPRITAVHLRHTGTFNLSGIEEQWRAFTSAQQVVVDRPGFVWDGRIAMLPGLPVYVHDAYVAGEGVLHASLLGVVAMADLRGGADIAQGELMRFLAEAAWYPTALLPRQGVRWTGIDDRSAWVTLADGALSVSLRFTFLPDGPVDTVFAEARARTVDGTLVATPWQGRFWNYEDRGGVRVPIDGEVVWLLPAGPKPYWRGHMTAIAFEFAP